jgi:hypothetical protein
MTHQPLVWEEVMRTAVACYNTDTLLVILQPAQRALVAHPPQVGNLRFYAEGHTDAYWETQCR